MENLIATYQDDDEEENTAAVEAPPSVAEAPLIPVEASLSSVEAPPSVAENGSAKTPEPEPEPELPTIDPKIPLKEPEPELPPTEPKIPLKEDDDDDDMEEDDEEEEPPPKKQKPLSTLTLTPPKIEEEEQQNGEITKLPLSTPTITAAAKETPTSTSSKKAKYKKKNNNNLWTKPSSRKGKKKKQNNNNNSSSNTKTNKNGAVPAQESEDKVYITPIPRFPDKNDDSPDMKICLSKVYKAEKVGISEDRLTAGSIKGYRMVRATRGVLEGAWYFEIKVMKLGESGHTRLGWSTDKGDLQAPVGYDGNSFGYRDIDGSKIHKALREKYGEQGYGEGDIIGFYINLPEGSQYAPKPPRLVWYKGQRYMCAADPKEDPPKIIPGSEISFFKNGVCQGVAFKDLYGGRYYPAASMYTLPDQPNCIVTFNFGPDFECFPEDFGGRAVPRPMVEVPYHGFDGRVENGDSWHSTRMCPMLKVVKENVNKIGEAAEMVS